MKTTKKCSSLVIIVLGLVLISSGLLAEENFEEKVKTYLIEKQVIKTNEQIIDILSLNNVKNFKDYDIFQVEIQEFPSPRRCLILRKNNETFLMSRDFNKLLKDSNEIINIKNSIQLAEKFIELSFINETLIEKSEYRNVTIGKIDYDIQLITYSKINGIQRQWNFKIHNDQFSTVRVVVIGVFVGDYQRNENISIPSVGNIQYLSPKLLSRNNYRDNIEIKNYQGDDISFSEPHDLYEDNVIVRKNGNATPTNERTVEINLTGFTILSDISILITIEKNATVHTLLDIVVGANAIGSASYDWEIPADVHTGKCHIFADDGSDGDEKDFFIYRSLNGDLPNENDYDYMVYYGDQFSNFNLEDIEDFADNCETSIIDVYQDEIVNWSFPSPLDIDLDDNLDIYGLDVMNAFARGRNNPINFVCIGIGYSAVDYFMTNYDYSTELDFLQTALCHEFLHAIQYHYSNIFYNWGGSTNYQYITEGQARFIQTVYMSYHSSGSNEEFLSDRLYPSNSNDYLENDLNLSLKSVSYDYCIFWRFLYENYESGSEADKLQILIELLEESNNVGGDPIVDGEIAFNNALSAGGGNYPSLDDAITDFSKRCYLNDPTYNLWNPCPSNDFYTSPPITNDNNSDGITNTFSGNTIIEPNSIPSSFGIDYMVFDFDEEVNFVSLHFEGDPDDDSDMADFYVNVLLFEGTTLHSESEITLTDGEGTLGFEVNNPIDKAVVTVARLDTDESTSDNDYFVKLTQGIDVSLVIDRSGSMGGDEIVQAKNASNQFVALLNHGDNIAVSSFESSASVNFSLTTIESDQTKIDAQNAINSINASGGTSIGAGMQTGQGELNINSNPNYPQAMILLSDGQENEAPMVADILPTIPEDTDIYTIGLGSGADALLLSQISNYTGGFYSFSPGPSGLSNIFNTIMQKVSDNQQIANFPGTISGSRREEIIHNFIIDGSMQETTFSLLWQNSSNDLDLELIAPDSTIINPSYATTNPYISFSSFPATEFYTVTLPDSGQWRLKVIGVSIAGTEDYVASVSGYSGLELDIAFDNDNYIGQDTVTVTAILTDDEIPILGATIEAEIETPTRNEGEILKEIYNHKKKNGIGEDFVLNEKLEFENHQDRNIRTDYLTLYDDGAHGDGDADDGIYGNFYTNTATVGSYSFNISASGTSPTAGPFTRQSFRSIFIQEPPEINFSATVIDFGDVIINTTGTFDLSIYNIASSAAADLDITNIQSTDPFFQPDTTEYSILAGNAETLTITFSPTVIDSFECNLLMQSNDPDEHSIQLTMKGNCVPPPDINVSVDSLSMTLDEGTSNDTTITIYNTGGYYLDYSITLQDTSSRLRDYTTIGAGGSVSTSTNDTPFGTFYHDGQNHYLFTANELSTAGLISGNINSVGWNIASAASQVMNGFNIELKHTSATNVTGFETGFTNCYSGAWTASTGWNDISFSSPFNWNGTSNLLVKICFDNTSYTTNSSCYIDTYSAMNGWAYNDGTTGCSDPYEGTIDSRPQIRFSGSTNNWLSVYPSSGIVNPSDSINVIVSFSAEEVELRETFTYQIEIESNDPDESVINIPVIMNANSAPVLSMSDYSCDDDSTGNSMGDGNGRWEPEERIEIILDIANTGSLDAELVTGYLSTSDTYVIILEGTASFGNIVSGDTITCVNPLLIEITPDAPDSHLVSLNIEISDDHGRIWNVVFEEYIHLDSDIEISQNSYDVTLAQGDTTSTSLIIYNNGLGNLNFNLSDIERNLFVNRNGNYSNPLKMMREHFIYPALNLAKGEIDTRRGDPVIDGQGGPDNFGYTWIDSDETGGPVFEWFDISGIGVNSGLSGDDSYITLDLPFDFLFYGELKTNLKVSTNGYITFGNDGNDYSNDPIPNSTDPNDFIAPFWDDLHQRTGSNYYYYDSSNNRFIVQYSDWGRYSGTGHYYFQIHLYENGSIYFYFDNMVGDLNSSTVGIENFDASDGLQITFNTDYIHNGLAILITPSWFTYSPISGNILPNDNLPIALYFDATNLEDGDYNKDIIISSNDPNIPEITIPVTLHVIGTIDIPQNVIIEVIESDIQISWDEVTGANSYIIFASDNPYGTFEDVSEYGSFNVTSWSTPITVFKKFYYVVASSEMRDFLPISSKRPKVISKKSGKNYKKPKTSDKSVIEPVEESIKKPIKKKAKIEWKK